MVSQVLVYNIYIIPHHIILQHVNLRRLTFYLQLCITEFS